MYYEGPQTYAAFPTLLIIPSAPVYIFGSKEAYVHTGHGDDDGDSEIQGSLGSLQFFPGMLCRLIPGGEGGAFPLRRGVTGLE